MLDEFLNKLDKKLQICKSNKQSDLTSTYIPYYDSIIEKKERNKLCEIKMDPITEARVLHHGMIMHMINGPEKMNDLYKIGGGDEVEGFQVVEPTIKSTSTDLLQYRVKKSHKSGILSDL